MVLLDWHSSSISIRTITHGTAIPTLSVQDLSGLKIPVPDKRTQEKIISEVSRYFSLKTKAKEVDRSAEKAKEMADAQFSELFEMRRPN